MNHPDRAPGVRLITDSPRDERTLDQIRDLPEVVEADELAPELVEDEPRVLLERSFAGWSVELRLVANGQVAVYAQRGEDAIVESVVVPGEKALDAFHHPFCYLPR